MFNTVHKHIDTPECIRVEVEEVGTRVLLLVVSQADAPLGVLLSLLLRAALTGSVVSIHLADQVRLLLSEFGLQLSNHAVGIVATCAKHCI